MAKFPAAFEDSTGKIQRLSGEIEFLPGSTATVGDVLTVQADKSIAAAPGGSSPVQGVYQGNATSIADGVNAALTWDTLLSGTDVLAFTPGATSQPAPRLGLYLLTYQVQATSSLSPGGYADVSTSDPTTGATAVGVLESYGVTLSLSTIIDPGDTLAVFVFNQDGVSSRDFTMIATVVLL